MKYDLETYLDFDIIFLRITKFDKKIKREKKRSNIRKRIN